MTYKNIKYNYYQAAGKLHKTIAIMKTINHEWNRQTSQHLVS